VYLHILRPILSAAVFFGCLPELARPANATEFTAGVVMEKMTAEQRYSFVAGVVEGLAYARFASDGKDTTGMKCIYGWFYDDPKVTDLIYAAFQKYPDFTPGAVVAALAKRKCGQL
jgi:hypothetical protein